MAERERRRKSAPARESEEVEDTAPPSSEQGEKIKADLDQLLDEIDEVLEDNADDSARAYVQNGGQ